MNSLLKNLKPYPMEELNRLKAQLKERGIKIYDFGTGDPKEPTDRRIREALINAVPEVSQYPSVYGKRKLRLAAANWLERRFGVRLDADSQIIPSNGSKEAIFHFPLVFIDTDMPEKSRVVFGTPAYPVYERGTLYAGGKPTPVPLKEEDGFLLRLDRLDRGILEETRIVWINYPHNPTGATASLQYYEDTVGICREYGIILCSDECYTEIYFDRKPPSALQVGTEGVVAFHSLSKRSGLTGYRTGFIAGDRDLIAEYRKGRASFGVATPDFIQEAAAVAWSDEEHVEERRRIFREKREIFLDFFRRIGLEFLSPEATFYFWVKAPANRTGEEYAKHLLNYGIVVSPGVNFCSGLEVMEGRCSSPYFRIALVPTVGECKEAVKVWEKAHREFL
ncbi:MAG: succinyldiaminopimelate transaminase [Aquificae bacterium]|nr:succinyldiaminopimelate transaminase [Aquificota bacterium]